MSPIQTSGSKDSAGVLVNSAWIRRSGILCSTIYIIAVSAYLMTHRAWPTPDFLIPPLILIALLSGRGWRFVVDWLPFLAILMAYEAFRGVADDLNSRVHIKPLIDADRWLTGGTIPTVWLQNRYWDPDHIHWYDWVASILHATHYAVSIAFGFWLWMESRSTYWRCAATLLLMFMAGILTQYFYPAAPPWMAAQMDYIPPVERIIGPMLSHLSTSPGFSLAYHQFSPNDVAAMPALHAALPLLLALIVIDLKGLKAAPALIYPLVGGLAWIYLGEHYLIDDLIGWLYAIASFVLFWILGPTFLRRCGLASLGLRLQRKFAWQRPLPSWPLAVTVVSLAVFVWFHPLFYAPQAPKPPPENTNVQGSLEIPELSPVACSDYGPRAMPDEVLSPYAKSYAAFIQGLESGDCLAITSARGFEPLTDDELEGLRVAIRESNLRGSWPLASPDGLTYLSVGTPSTRLAASAPVNSDQLYVLVVRVDRNDSQAELEAVVRQLANVVFN